MSRINRNSNRGALRCEEFLHRRAQEANLKEEFWMEDDVYFQKLKEFEIETSQALDVCKHKNVM